MYKLSRLVAAFTTLALSGVAVAGQQGGQDRVETRFGTLDVDQDLILRFNQVPVAPTVQGNTGIRVVDVYQFGDYDVALVEDRGGAACPVTLYFVTVSSSGAYASEEFGTCAEIGRVVKSRYSVTVWMPELVGVEAPSADRATAKKMHRYVYRAGVLSEH